MAASDPAYALALLALDGVGRATAHRLLAHFPTPEALHDAPREQILLRLRGLPRAADLVERLATGGLDAPLAKAQAEAAAFAERRMVLLTPGHPDWPTGLDRLTASERPVVLYAYGNTAVLNGPSADLLARAPIPAAPYEAAQTLARRLMDAGAAVVSALRPGFDVVMHKLAAGAGRPGIAVAPSGLGRVDGSVRPGATALVRAGGVMLSPFPMEHGPFEHDDRERALVQAALARAVAAFAPADGSAELRALKWAAGAKRPAFIDPGPEPGVPPTGSIVLDGPADLDVVIAAATRADAA